MTTVIEGGGEFDVVIIRLRMIDLIMDRYQRAYRESDSKKIARTFEAQQCDTLVVSARSDGTFACIDGQHRAKALLIKFGPDVTWPCRVISGLSFEDEARLFRALNEYRRPMSVMARFHSALLGGDPEAVRVSEIIESNGFRVGSESIGHSADDHYIRAIGTVLKVHREYGEDALVEVLSIYAEAFGNRPAPGVGELQGIATMLSRYRGIIDRGRLIRAMKTTTVSRWRADAADMKRVLGASEAVGAGMVMTRAYNRGLRESLRLPDWSAAGQAVHGRDAVQRSASNG
jgi:hypothetical protein